MKAHTTDLPELPQIIHRLLFDGGFTAHPDGSPEPDHGYYVTLPGHDAQLSVTAEDLPQQILTYYRRKRYVLRHPWRRFGGWVDRSTLYLSINIHVETLAEATKLGKEYDQRAIWDIANKGIIFLYGDDV